MTDSIAELTERARRLAPEERVRLATDLLASLDEPVDPDVDAAWDAEIRKRLTEVESGEVSLVSFDEAIVRVRRSLR